MQLTAVKRIHQFVASLLALCVAGAGAVGLSPSLHRLVEHGGQGAAHTHFVQPRPALTAAHAHDHGDGQVHGHAQSDPRPDSIFAHSHRPFSLPGIARLWHGLSHFFTPPASSEPPSSEESPSHEHHSLFQLMGGGLVEQPLDVPVLPLPPTAVGSITFPAHTPFDAREWNAQTASRGPPSQQG